MGDGVPCYGTLEIVGLLLLLLLLLLLTHSMHQNYNVYNHDSSACLLVNGCNFLTPVTTRNAVTKLSHEQSQLGFQTCSGYIHVHSLCNLVERT